MYKAIIWIIVNSLMLANIFLGFQNVRAQNAPVVSAGSVINAVPGQEVTIPVTISNFNNIGSISLSMDYDPTKLQFVSANLNPLLFGNYNVGDNPIAINKHQLVLGWYSMTGASLPDGAFIVNYVFTYLSGSPTLTWFENGPSCDFSDPFGIKLNDIPSSTHYINGLVCGTLPNTVAINGVNTVYFGQTNIDYSVPLDPTFSYNWTYSGSGATITGTTNAVKISFSSTATSGTLSVTTSNACTSVTTSKNIQLSTIQSPTFTTGPKNVTVHSSGNVYTTQSGKLNYIWSVNGGRITAGGGSLDNSATITWTKTGTQSVSVMYDDQGVSTPVATYPVTVNPALLTLTGITSHKIYNGNTTAILNANSLTLNGVLGTDVVTINSQSIVGTYNDKNVGSGKIVTITGFTLNGPDAGNYILNQSTAIGDITPSYLTISGVTADSKSYDGTNMTTLNSSSVVLSGVLNSDNVILNASNATGNFSDKNVGSGKTVITSGFIISGTDAANYTLFQPLTIANINPVKLNITGVTIKDKIYDGNTSATLNTSSASLSGVIGSDVVTLLTSGATGNFASKNVASSIAVTTSGFGLGGLDAGNYSLIQPVTSGVITAATLTVSGLTGTKVYSGTVAISLNTSSAILNGVIQGDFVTLNTSGVAAIFDDKNVGTNKSITTSGFSLRGQDAGNYIVISPLITGNITPMTLSVTGVTANNKPYDGNTIATLNTNSAILTGVITPDVVTLISTNALGTFVNKNAASGIQVTTSGFSLAGTNAGNYILTQPSVFASITPFGLSITIEGVTADNKVYDGNTSAILNTVNAKMVGIISPDIVFLNMVNVTGNFVDKNAGIGKTIITSGFSISGQSAANYTLMQPLLKADILPFATPLTITNLSANSKTYDGTNTAGLNTGSATLTGMIPTDVVTLNVNDAIGTFIDKKTSIGKQVITSGFKLNGLDAGNYILTQPVLNADINVAKLTISGVTANNKTYDGTTTVVLNTLSAKLNGVFGLDNVKLLISGATGFFANKNVATGIQVTTSGFNIGGTDSVNYTYTQPITTADIISKSLKITAKDDSKCFGQSYLFTNSSYSIEGLVNNEVVNDVSLTCNGMTTNATAGAYDIIPGNATGSALTNYTITFVKGQLTVNPAVTQPDNFLIFTSTVCKGTVGVAYSIPNVQNVTYSWSYSGMGVTIKGTTNAITLDFSATATSGILSVTANTLCGTSIARTIPITVSVQQTKPVIVIVDKTLSSNVPTGNQWYKNMIPIQGATGQSYTATENGKYFSVNSNNCYSDTSNFVDVIITNTTQQMNTESFQLFPNPAKEYFTLRFVVPIKEPTRVSIFSSECVLIKTYDISDISFSKEYQIDIRNLLPGLYFIRIDNGRKTITKKLIIL